jgi:hypothetical protein
MHIDIKGVDAMSANNTLTASHTRFTTERRVKQQKETKSIWRQMFDAWLFSYSMLQDALGNVIGEV